MRRFQLWGRCRCNFFPISYTLELYFGVHSSILNISVIVQSQLYALRLFGILEQKNNIYSFYIICALSLVYHDEIYDWSATLEIWER